MGQKTSTEDALFTSLSDGGVQSHARFNHSPWVVFNPQGAPSAGDALGWAVGVAGGGGRNRAGGAECAFVHVCVLAKI